MDARFSRQPSATITQFQLFLMYSFFFMEAFYQIRDSLILILPDLHYLNKGKKSFADQINLCMLRVP